MNILNKFVCVSSSGGNTAIPDCEFIPANIVGAILVPASTEYTPTQILTLDTVLQTQEANDDPSQRVYPVKRFEGLTDSSSEDTTSETAYGTTFKVRDGKPVFQFQLNNGMNSWSNLKDFDNQHTKWRVLWIDEENNVIWGRGTTTGNLTGFSLTQLSVSLPKLNDGSTPFHYMVTFGISSAKQLQQFSLVQFEDSVVALDIVSGLLPVTLKATSTLSAGVVSVRAMSAGTDLYSLYSSNLNDVAGWKATNALTGADIIVSSLALTTGADTWDVTLDIADPDYPSSGEYLNLSLSAPSVLAVAPVTMPGYVSGPAVSLEV